MRIDNQEYFEGNAVTGSRKLRDAIMKAAGFVAAVPVAPTRKRPNRRRGRPRGSIVPRVTNPGIILIQSETARHFGIKRCELVGCDPQWRYSRPRQVAMYLARQTGASFPDIGWHFNRDHTTILHAFRAVPKRMELWTAAQEIHKLLTAEYPEIMKFGDKPKYTKSKNRECGKEHIGNGQEEMAA